MIGAKHYLEGPVIFARFDSGSRNLRTPTEEDGRFAIDRLPNELLALTAYLQPESDHDRKIRTVTTVHVSPNQEGLQIMIDPKVAKRW